ncbi:penicillin-binding protein 1B [Salinisphaera sp.]|uniref:penicillin-binding protein 1B n=1 Tax=Salinisphaera sp. TaxID=1914330 RepID=UPI002D76DC7B|nr:penicillin-binding protein 1B [Salinisphaera sp.]HET7312859.1 penicillin-binding protein 1B [Salinisphaera sp.]
MAKKSRKSGKRSKPRRGKPRGWFRRLLPYLALIFCACAAALALYMVHLDHEVRSKFEGTRWKLPAKVYASPLELYAGLDLSEHELEHRLERQGYREADSIDDQGTFKASGSTLSIHTRQFQFWDGTQPDREIRLSFNDAGVASIKAIDGKGKLALIRLDPMLIGSIYPTKGSDRILVKLGDVPPMLPAGLITVEDRNFMTNWGVSPEAIIRAAWADLRAGEIVQGGSTITQQLVKNFYLSNRQTIGRKIKEALMAILLDAHYSKAEILEAYINEVYLGQDGARAIHGFGLASYFYFNKPVQELQPQEIALLVAMVKGPSYYNPRRHPERAKQRRNLVLNMFHDAGFLKDKAWKKAKASDLGVTSSSAHSNTQYPAFIDLVRDQLHGQYKDSDLTEEGLRIFTTLDPSVQAAAEKAVSQGLTRVEKAHGIKEDSLQAAAVVTSVEGGKVLALVGGRNPGYAGFNRALDAHRQIGSLMKPVDYLTAIENPSKYNPITPLDDSALAVKLANGDIWRPQNYSRHSHGTDVPLYYALEHSLNVASSRLSLNVGIPNIIQTLHDLGYRGDPLAVPSLALGAVGMSPLEVAQIYNTLANGGYYTPLRAIRDVTTRTGKPLNRYPLEIHRVVEPGPAYMIQWLMERVARYGTGAGMYRILDRSKQMAGKTGTTNNLRDAWFAGFGSNRVGVVWVGRDDNKSAHLTGAVGALPIWSHIMDDINARGIINTPPGSIAEVPLRLMFDPDAINQGLGPNPDALYDHRQNCPNAVKVPFIKGYVPQGLAPCDTDIMSQNARHRQQRKKDEGNWFQRLF